MTCRDIKQIIARGAKLFVDFYTSHHPNEAAADAIFKHQFVYTVCQMVNGQ
jgi:hypothetical protein